MALMQNIMDAHWLTIFIVMLAYLVTPGYLLCTYPDRAKGLKIETAFWIWGAIMFTITLSGIIPALGLAGNILIPVLWIIPTFLLFQKQDWFLSEKLSQRWLIGLQVFRVIGGVFLIEMARNNIPGVFAYPAGIGDIIAGLLAVFVLWQYRAKTIPSLAIKLVIIVGVVDFLSALFFGITSAESPIQIFETDIESQLLLFPTGLIPLFLVPYAIFFHGLSYLNLKKFGE